MTRTSSTTNVTVGSGKAVHALRLAAKDGGRLHHDNVRCGAGRSNGRGFINAATIKPTDHAVTCKRCIRITASDAIWAGNATTKQAGTAQPITAESIQTDLLAQAAELLIINRAGEITIAEDAITIARNSPTTAAPCSAREMIHTALADARTQIWRAIEERKADERRAELESANALYAKFREIFSDDEAKSVLAVNAPGPIAKGTRVVYRMDGADRPATVEYFTQGLVQIRFDNGKWMRVTRGYLLPILAETCPTAR